MTNILIAFSDTGGGHRAAASALREEFLRVRPDVMTELVDPFALCPRWPFRSLGESYPTVIEHAPWLWHAGFRLTNTPDRTRFVQRLAWPAMRATFRSIADSRTPDVIVSTHPLLTAPLRRVFPETPIVVVVTDLITGHVSWYDAGADLAIVPTARAREAAVRCGIPKEFVRIIGVPVSRQFVAIPGERSARIEALGWSAARPTILLAGGADGVGPLESLSVALDRAQLPCDIAIVAGRNASLASQLRARRWHGTVHIYDFVPNFAEMLRAAAVLVTKAGPGTISEACASGCPIILHGAIPGQETGNIDFVTCGRAGVWAPSPLAVTAALHAWLVGRDAPAALRRASAAALRLARPEAAAQITAQVLAIADAARESDAPTPRRAIQITQTAA
ncbi:MAG: galactosyldiacylglycerol synthase [Gemmatimonadaceae bacterium]|nr:galactosyldiacylglycerol synthase [Gemmatimonadaceae bacterium]